MAGLNYYIKLPGYETSNVGIDVSPIQHAAEQISKSVDADRLDAYHNRSADISQQQADTHQQQIDQQGQLAQQQLDDKKLQQTGGIMQYLQGLPADDPQRATLWNAFVSHDPEVAQGLKQAGVDPTDHKAGVPFVLAKVQGYQDPLKQRLANSQIEERGAHAAYLDKAGTALEDRNNIRQQDADTRRSTAAVKAYGAVADRLGPNPDPAMYERENQVGGLIHTAFNGPVPREKWPEFYQQAQTRRDATPDEETMRASGTPEATIKALRDSNLLGRSLGPAKRGYLWEIDKDTGRPVQTLMAEKEDTKQKKIDTIAPFYIKNLDMARTVLGDSSMAGRAMASAPGGGYWNPKLVEARDMAGHAVVALTAAVEGQRHANAMDVRMLGFFQPAANDTHEIQQFKLDQASQFFKAWMSNKAKKLSDEQISEQFHSQLEKAYDKLLEKQGFKKPDRGPDAKAGKGTPRGMSNDELLRQLNE